MVCHEQPVAPDTDSRNVVALMTTRSHTNFYLPSVLFGTLFTWRVHSSHPLFSIGLGPPTASPNTPDSVRRWQHWSIFLLQTRHLLCRRFSWGPTPSVETWRRLRCWAVSLACNNPEDIKVMLPVWPTQYGQFWYLDYWSRCSLPSKCST